MTNREKFKKVFGIDVKWSNTLRPQVTALSSIQLEGISCAEEWLNSEYAGQDMEPVIHAKWIAVHPLQPDDDGALMCSSCRSGDWSIRMWYKRCPVCGAKMDLEEE